MLTSDTPQHLRHSCTPEEFKLYTNGEKTFDVKLNDGKFALEPGDLITLVEQDPKTGLPTGNKLTRRISYVLNTKGIANVSDEDLTRRGLSIFGLVTEDHRSLYSVYDVNYTVSIALDCTAGEEWEMISTPAYTPALTCPNLTQVGVLDGLNIEKWPEGRYSLTLMVYIDFEKATPPYEVAILDILLMTAIPSIEDDGLMGFTTLNPNAIVTGHALSLETDEKVQPMTLGAVEEALAREMTEEELDGHPELVSDATLQTLIQEAKERGEDVSDLEMLSQEQLEYEEQEEEEDDQDEFRE